MQFKKLILLSLFFSAEVLAQGGGGVGHGGDLRTLDPGDAWFVGADYVTQACIVMGPHFAVTAKQAKAQITAVYAKWNHYLMAKDSHFIAAKARPSTQVSFISDCTRADITFYLGEENAEVILASNQYQNPISFAQRTSKASPVGRGFIWVKDAEYWKHPEALYGILLHEIGHSLGNDHASGTIMDPNYPATLVQICSYVDISLFDSLTELTEIDQRAELVPGQRNFYGVLSNYTRGMKDFDRGLPSEFPGAINGEITFRKLMGRSRQGAIFTHLELPERLSAPSIQINPVKQTAKFTISDEFGEKTFTIALLTPLTRQFGLAFNLSANKAFYTHPEESALGTFNLAAQEKSVLGRMQTENGALTVQIEFNSSSALVPVQMFYVDPESLQQLMVTRFVNDTEKTFNPYRAGLSHEVQNHDFKTCGHRSPERDADEWLYRHGDENTGLFMNEKLIYDGCKITSADLTVKEEGKTLIDVHSPIDAELIPGQEYDQKILRSVKPDNQCSSRFEPLLRARALQKLSHLKGDAPLTASDLPLCSETRLMSGHGFMIFRGFYKKPGQVLGASALMAEIQFNPATGEIVHQADHASGM